MIYFQRFLKKISFWIGKLFIPKALRIQQQPGSIFHPQGYYIKGAVIRAGICESLSLILVTLVGECSQ